MDLKGRSLQGVLQFDQLEFSDSVAEKLEQESAHLKSLITQLLGGDPNNTGVNNSNNNNNNNSNNNSNIHDSFTINNATSNSNRYLIKEIDVLSDITMLLKDPSTSQSTKLKIFDELITIFKLCPQNCISVFVASQTCNSNNNSTSSEALRRSQQQAQAAAAMLRKSTTLNINRNMLLLDEIIQLLPSLDNEKVLFRAMTLIEMLASYHISVVQLKCLISYFDLSSPTSLRRGLSQLLTCLDKMTHKIGPNSAFNLDGMNAGLLLDPIGKLSNVGYSISMWINIDSFVSRSKSLTKYEPRLFSFLESGDGGSGIEAYFVKNKLVVRINSKVEAVVDPPFEANRWQHIVVQQQPSKWNLFKQSSVLTVYLDGRQIHQCEIKYPSTSKLLTMCSIGMVHSNTANAKTVNSQIAQCCLRGQLGPISFMTGVLSENKVNKIFKLGSNMVLSPQYKNNMALSKKFPRILFSFSPKTYHSGVCHDVGHHKESDSTLNSHSTGSLTIYSTFSIKDSLYCLGGPQILFPLISQMAERPSQLPSDYPSIQSILSFLAHILKNDNIQQEEMIKTNGFELLGHLLEQVMKCAKANSLDINSNIIQSIDELIQSCSKNETLLLSIYQNIVFNFHIWISTSKDIQITLLRLALDKTINSIKYIRKYITVRSLLDSVKYYYAQGNNNNNSTSVRSSVGSTSNTTQHQQQATYSSSPLLSSQSSHQGSPRVNRLSLNAPPSITISGGANNNVSSNNNIYNNGLTANDTKEIISYIFTLIEMIITSNSNDNKDDIPEVQDLIEFVQDSTCDNIFIIETLSIFLKLIHSGSRGFLSSFEQSGDIKPLFGLLRRDNEYIKVLSLKIIGKYLSRASSSKGLAKTALSSDNTFHMVTDSLIDSPMTDLIYRTLSELVVDKIAPSISETSNSPLLDLVGNHDLTGVVFNIDALQSICTLGTRAFSSLQQQILNEVSLCIKHMSSVRQAIMESNHWQSWMLSMWPSPPSTPSSPLWSPPLSPSKALFLGQPISSVYDSPILNAMRASAQEPRPAPSANRVYQSGVKEILTGILKILLNDCVAKRDGWKVIEETQAWVSTMLPNGLPLERRIFYECLVKLEQDIKNPSNQSVGLKNYVNLISIIEDFVFSHSMNILAHRNNQSQWEDFGLVAKLLDIFDNTQSIQTQVVQKPGPTGSNSASTSLQQQHQQQQHIQAPSFIVALSSNIDLPTIDVSSGSSKAKSSINTILRFIMCIFQEAESCFYGERQMDEQLHHHHQQQQQQQVELTGDEEERSFVIRVWGLPLISEEIDQIISKNSIRIQTILASERDQKEQVRHVMWVISILINIIRRYREHNNDPILKRTQSIIISLLKSLLKTYGDLIDTHIAPSGVLSPQADQSSSGAGRTIGIGDTTNQSLSNHLFSVHSISSLNEPGDAHSEFLTYFKEKLLYKIPLLDHLHEAKDLHENANLVTAFAMTRKNKVVEQIKQAHQKEQESVMQKVQKVQNKAFSMSQKMEINELQRRNMQESTVEGHRRWADRLWRKNYKRLTREITPWGYTDRSAPKKFWKLISQENSNRQSRLLKRDYKGSDHVGAALRPSNAQAPGAAVPGTSTTTTTSSSTSRGQLPQDVDLLQRVASKARKSNMSSSVDVLDEDDLVGFEMEDGDIVVDESHTNSEWCVVSDGFNDEPSSTQSISSSLGMPSSITSTASTTTSSSLPASATTHQPTDKPLYSTGGEIIKPMIVIRVHIIIYQSRQLLVSASSTDQEDPENIPASALVDRVYDIKKIIGVQHRRYLLLPTAIEIFFSDRRSLLLNFPSAHIMALVVKHLSNLCESSVFFKNASQLQLFDNNRGVSPQQTLLKYLNPTQRWKRREISNFEYLMTLNTIAGRSYNDLNQYPVFPWVIADYNSEQLDLNNPATYRDLSKPIGALNPTRLELFIERYQQCPKEIPAFMYGTHYSSSGSVMFFLMRCEPFTSHFIKLQSGHFDHADRMFDSVVDCWRNCLNSSSDVKELTPEFFYMPEFLLNLNNVHFGVKQNGKVMSEAVLPPWAKTSFHYVLQNRMALESEYVSQNLHHWIDLIFGHKQRGKEAIAAHNVFYYLTYEGSVDIGAMQDPILREATRVQINNFGVTPSQLFQTPHVQRDPPKSVVNRLSLLKMLKPLQMVSIPFSPARLFMFSGAGSSGGVVGPVGSVVGSSNKDQGDRVLILGANSDIQFLKINYDNSTSLISNSVAGSISPISSMIPISVISQLNVHQFPISFSQSLKTRIGHPYCSIPNNHRILFASGKYEYTLYVIFGDSRLSIGQVCHKAPITCITYQEIDRGEKCGVGGVSLRQRIVVTGSEDTTAIMWLFNEEDYSVKPLHTLRGHDLGVTCVVLDADNDICVTGSKDGTIIIHTILKGTYIRTITHPNNLPINNLTLTDDGSIFFYSNSTVNSGDNDGNEEKHIIYRYSINGYLIQTIPTDIQPSISKMVQIRSSTGMNGYFITSGGYQIIVRELLNLEIIHVFDVRNLSSFINSNIVVDFCLWNGSEQSIQENSNSKIDQLSLLVLLESCQLLIYNIDDNGIKSLSD
ncbi:hypothetical protein SAMD00019534_053170 [Acytostelium subglobosum LB1]|uniref:hypothetical protein n=1 Tax=Acytostelium subglobosum LB1 TaxID=1410327 RepID=UPI0006452030|nr:hypothetical protein SAMD00019534_053170 [Acytostelium subglobosum LB1]GAM22142.1 hypothetical protein SAMD00019534_053170 [Acytostelium subglobosum LB1]|eukprot:XP_012755242.1 hypothetical protein SAMD00019534_053170 [Acytostelium subglobosum LB1]